jgi:hypothetical protein
MRGLPSGTVLPNLLAFFDVFKWSSPSFIGPFFYDIIEIILYFNAISENAPEESAKAIGNV